MFGGLDVKGTPDRSKAASNNGGGGAAPVGSSFSFVNSTISAAPAAAPSSGFSFLTMAGPPPETAASPSAFSFLTKSMAVPAPPLEEPSAAPAASGFSFLTAAAPSSEEEIAAPTATETASSSSFFMTTGKASPGAAAAGDTANVSTMTRDSTNDNHIPAPATSTPPLGAGITFASNALAAAPKPLKKRNRTAKIGMAAAPNPISELPPPQQQQTSSAAATAAPNANYSPPATSSNNKTIDEAAQAARRAEEFIQQKLKQQQQAQLKQQDNNNNNNTQQTFNKQKSLDENDEIVQKAIAAAEEAQHQMQASSTAAASSWRIGKFFAAAGAASTNSRVSPPTTSTNSSHGVSASSFQHRVTSAPAAAPPLSKPEFASSSSAPPSVVAARASAVNESTANSGYHHQQPQKEHLKQQQEDIDVGTFQPPALARGTSEPMKHKSVTHFIHQEQKQKLSSSPTAATSINNNNNNSTRNTAAPPAPKPKTPTDEFHDLLHHFREKVDLSMQQVAHLRQQRSGLLEERHLVNSKLRLAMQQQRQATEQQLAYAEQEEFELADRLTAVVEAHAREQEEYEAILETIGQSLRELESQIQKSVENVTRHFSSIHETLGDFLKQQQVKDTDDGDEAMKRFLLVSKQLSTENERLQHDWKHLERDAELVAEERKELELAISDQSGEFEKLRDGAKLKLSVVEQEIEALRQQLLLKQQEAAVLRTEANGHEEAILKVRVKFSRQLTRIQNKEKTIRDNQEEWTLEKQAYELHKHDHEEKMKLHSEALLARDSLLQSLKSEMKLAKTFEEIVAKEIMIVGGHSPLEEDDTDGAAAAAPKSGDGGGDGETKEEGTKCDLAQLQANVVKCEAAVSEAKEILKVSKALLANLQQEVEDIEFKIPILEATKKAAAARRDFKAAGSASKEIKEATARLRDCQDTLIAQAQQKVQHATAELETVTIELQEKRNIAQEQERQSSIALMQLLQTKIKRLMATKAAVCGGGTADDDDDSKEENKEQDDAEQNNKKTASAAAAENNNNNNNKQTEHYSVSSVGSLVLEGQIRALKEEGQALGEKYGLWEELMAEIGATTTTTTESSTITTEQPEDDEMAEQQPATLSDSAADPDTTTAADTTTATTASVDNNNNVDPAVVQAEKLTTFRQLSQQMKEIEDSLERAVANEDYDKAAELDEAMQKLISQTAALGLTEDEMAAALENTTGGEGGGNHSIDWQEEAVQVQNDDQQQQPSNGTTTTEISESNGTLERSPSSASQEEEAIEPPAVAVQPEEEEEGHL